MATRIFDANSIKVPILQARHNPPGHVIPIRHFLTGNTDYKAPLDPNAASYARMPDLVIGLFNAAN